ncbi:MAG TPA: hypothetical protein VIO64_20165 [Pseudobacteroides sp.]|uniref:hypothetical protein n=1 Tax=Pseudobacteroides sp. TaxID=1968840 RepID=UPI002F91DD27
MKQIMLESIPYSGIGYFIATKPSNLNIPTKLKAMVYQILRRYFMQAWTPQATYM